jgi:hypothetical protein
LNHYTTQGTVLLAAVPIIKPDLPIHKRKSSNLTPYITAKGRQKFFIFNFNHSMGRMVKFVYALKIKAQTLAVVIRIININGAVS